MATLYNGMSRNCLRARHCSRTCVRGSVGGWSTVLAKLPYHKKAADCAVLAQASGAMDVSASPQVSEHWQGALCRFQNCLWLLQDIRLKRSVSFKVYKNRAIDDASGSQYMVIVHVRADKVFAEYFDRASQADMTLFRGMFMSLTVQGNPTSNGSSISNCAVKQAFLPKFANEGQDVEIAAAIQAAADTKYMLVTVKHSGSLATMSYNLMGAKNSQGNMYTAVAVLILNAHYERVAATMDTSAQELTTELLNSLEEQGVSVSFEVVSRCLGHHGQLPDGEYLVVTSVTRLCPDGRLEVLPWLEYLRFCHEHHLPVNDAWLFSSPTAAAAATATLEATSNAALSTAAAVAALNSVVAAHPEDAVHMPGTYPHAEWQGSRIEGFVVAAGAEVTEEGDKELREVAETLKGDVLPGDCGGALKRCAEQKLQEAGVARGADRVGDIAAAYKTAQQVVREVAPGLSHLLGTWTSVPDAEERAVMALVQKQALPLTDATALQVVTAQPDTNGASGEDSMEVKVAGGPVPSRHAIASATTERLVQLAGDNAVVQELFAPPAAGKASEPRLAKGTMSTALQELCGPLRHTGGLRYKKKMWSFRLAGEPMPEGVDVGTSEAALAGHVGYCMMTFIIRNGLRHLRKGESEYNKYVMSLVKRWGLGPEERQRVRLFGRRWAKWAYARGHAKSVRDYIYLDAAEEFVREFLESGVASGAVEGKESPSAAKWWELQEGLGAAAGAPGRFKGVVVLVGFGDDVVEQVAMRVGAQVVTRGGTRWKPDDVNKGVVVGIQPMKLQTLQAGPGMLSKTASQGRLKVLRRPPLESADGDMRYADDAAMAKLLTALDQAAKKEGQRAAGKRQAKTMSKKKKNQLKKERKQALQGKENADVLVAEKEAVCVETVRDDYADVVGGEDGSPAMIEQLVEWIGSQFPSIQSRPTLPSTLIVTFISTPGLGKTSLCEELIQRLAKRHTVIHHHSDEVPTKERRNYWPNASELATKALSSDKPGSTIILADKNLIDNPPGNFDKCASQIETPGAQTLAVLLTDAASAQQTTEFPGSPAPSTKGGPPAPFSLNQLALAALRVGMRKNHVGGLDADLPDALRILFGFASSFRYRTPARLHAQLSRSFDNVLFLPVTMPTSSAPPLAPDLREELDSLMVKGFEEGGFGKGGRLSAAWERQVRELFANNEDVKAYLEGFAANFEEEVVALEAAVEKCAAAGPAFAAEALNGGLDVGAGAGTGARGRYGLATNGAGKNGAGTNGAQGRNGAGQGGAGSVKLSKVVYAALEVDRSAVAEAFTSAQKAAGGGAVHEAKDELHITLWHKADLKRGGEEARQRGTSCVAAEGQDVPFAIVGFDVTDNLGAARVVFGQAEGVGAEVLDVAVPHVTMFVGQGEKPFNARFLKERYEKGEAGVKWLPLAEPLKLTGKVKLVC